MTDNRTTELRISEPLRGFIRHQSNRAYIDGGQARWLTKIADEIDAKHEQAVAATLGSGTLTAEQVREAIACNSWQETSMLFEFNASSWQAIADELNARAERTCKLEWTCLGKTQTQEFWLCECGNCGHEFGEEDRRSHPFKVTVDEVYIPNYCPECGARTEVDE